MSKKEKVLLFEHANILDLLAAKELQEESITTIEKTKEGMKYSLFAMAFFIGGSVLNKLFATIEWLEAPLFLISILGWFAFLIMAVKAGGGLKKVLAVSWKVVKFVWFIVPIVFFDIVIALFAGAYVIMGYFYCPIVYFWLMNVQAKKDLKAAEKYIALYASEVEKLKAEV